MITIQFEQINLYWKGGWFIDGGSLQEITQKQMDDEICIMNKKKEEEERKRIFERINDEDEKEK